MTTGDLLLELLPDRIRRIHRLSAEMDTGQAVLAFEVLDYVSMVRGSANLRDTKEPDEFFFGHDGGARTESAILCWEYGW